MENYKSGCLVCGEELKYSKTPSKQKCYYCNNYFDSDVSCKNDHFVCDNCHGISAFSIIEKHCCNSLETDPIKIANKLMAHKTIKMHGHEHLF